MKADLISKLELRAEPDKIAQMEPYFGIKPGFYGEGDILLAISVPVMRKICKNYREMPENEVIELLHSEVHEFRFAGLLILREKYDKANLETKAQLKDLYLNNLEKINNWDLVDESAPNILGRWCLENKNTDILHELSQHKDNLWHKRISIVAYLYFYRRKILSDGLDNIDLLLEDEHPLIHKANGWMLRSIYNYVDKHLIESYIIDNYKRMPRVTLRYAIEHMPEEQRQDFLKGRF